MKWFILFLIGLFTATAIKAENEFLYKIGDLVRVRIGETTVCRGYVAEAIATQLNRYRISPIICRGMKYYNVWVNEDVISK